MDILDYQMFMHMILQDLASASTNSRVFSLETNNCSNVELDMILKTGLNRDARMYVCMGVCTILLIFRTTLWRHFIL